VVTPQDAVAALLPASRGCSSTSAGGSLLREQLPRRAIRDILSYRDACRESRGSVERKAEQVVEAASDAAKREADRQKLGQTDDKPA